MGLLKDLKKALAEGNQKAYDTACENCIAYAQKLKVENEKHKIPETLRRVWAKEDREIKVT